MGQGIDWCVKTAEIQASNSLQMDWDAALAVDIGFATVAGQHQQDQSRNTSSSSVPTVIARTFSFSLMEQVYALNADVNSDGANDFILIKWDYCH
jgi:hypothetical protein